MNQHDLVLILAHINYTSATGSEPTGKIRTAVGLQQKRSRMALTPTRRRRIDEEREELARQAEIERQRQQSQAEERRQRANQRVGVADASAGREPAPPADDGTLIPPSPIVPQPTAMTEQQQNQPAPAAGANAANQQIAASPAQPSPFDTFIPKIPEVKAEDIKARFKIQTLPEIEGEPYYEALDDTREWLARNAMAVETSFGGGDHGHLGLVETGVIYQTLTGHAWYIPTTQGIFPIFAQGATNAEKRDEVAKFIVREGDIKKAKLTEELLRNQLLKAVEEKYYLELKDRTFRYDRVKLNVLLAHLFKHYGKIDEMLISQNKETFNQPPDMSQPIDVYFDRLLKCQKLSADAGYKIEENDMVLQLATSLGTTGLINEEYNAWRKKPISDRTWATAKTHFRDALEDASGIEKLTTAGGGLLANSATKAPAAPTTKAIEDHVRKDIAEQLGESFDNLALAATMKSDVIESLTKSVAELTAMNNTLVEEVKKLREGLDKALKALRNNGGGGDGGGDVCTQANRNGPWPSWTDPDAYCWSCGYKLRKGHTSATCRLKHKPQHKKEATRQNTMGGSTNNKGWGNPPNGM